MGHSSVIRSLEYSSITPAIMSCPVNTFNKSKEDFIWFVKKAVTDQKSYSHSELYHSLLKLFVDADTNKDGLVSRASFSKLIDAAAAELYKSEAEKDASRQRMFDSMDLKSTGVITFDEGLRFCREHIAAKVSTMDAHPILDSGSVEQYKLYLRAALASPTSPEYVELYWFMLELFTEADTDTDGDLTVDEWIKLCT